MECSLSFASRKIEPVTATTAFLLDDVWPEYEAFICPRLHPDDQILTPGVLGRTLSRYDWSFARPTSTWPTLQRHLMMRRVAKAAGAVRQMAYLKSDKAIAEEMARRLDYRAKHLVIQQSFLPFLWRQGVLGGRTFDVLMTRYPLEDLHQRLDAFYAAHPESATIHDFRAPPELVKDEAEALDAARRVITPHHDIALGFGSRGFWLDWRRPPVLMRRQGTRVAFLGPTITRQGIHQAREIAGKLTHPMIVFGADLEGGNFWEGTRVERRRLRDNWMDGIAAIIHPAAVSHQPRRLLQAVVHGIAIYALPSCGLAPREFKPIESFVDPELAAGNNLS